MRFHGGGTHNDDDDDRVNAKVEASLNLRLAESGAKNKIKAKIIDAIWYKVDGHSLVSCWSVIDLWKVA